jgi:hypothetical protein
MPTCQHGSAIPDHVLRGLHASQAGQRDNREIWRHKCCHCAFARGEEYGRANAGAPGGNAECLMTHRRAPFDVMDALPFSQAGVEGETGRHQCAICAYHEGFNAARARAIGRQVGDNVAQGIADALPDLDRNRES